MTDLLMPPPMLAAGPSTDPAEVLGLAEGMFAIDVFTAALVRFGAVQALRDGPLSVPLLASRTGMTERATRVVLSLFEVLGVVEPTDGAQRDCEAPAGGSARWRPNSCCRTHRGASCRSMRHWCDDRTARRWQR